MRYQDLIDAIEEAIIRGRGISHLRNRSYFDGRDKLKQRSAAMAKADAEEELKKELERKKKEREAAKEGHSPHKKGTKKYKAHMAAMHAEAADGEKPYVCVHAKKGKYECHASTTYGAAKKAAEHWGLKSTAGIDAHLADKEKTATESIEEGRIDGAQIIGALERIVDQKQAQEVKFVDGKAKVDLYTASAFMKVYNKVNDDNKAKMAQRAEQRGSFMSLMKKVFELIQDFIMKYDKLKITEAEFDEAAGEKDACYHKVKSRYKVWPSAYASGALSKCRKVGAKNWGNKSKK